MQYNIKQCFKFSYILLLFILIGCNSTKHLKSDEYLLTENSFKFELPKDTTKTYKPLPKSEQKRLTSDLYNIVAQKPNNSFLVLFKPRLFFYNATTRPKKEARREAKGKAPRNKMSNWLHTKIGEAPVVYDSTLLSTAESKMTNFMINEGYFNANISSEHTLQKKKAQVSYIITPKNRFYFNNYYLEIEDTDIEKVVKENMEKTHIVHGDPYTTDALKLEQERIASVLNNRGFFSFSKNNITFEVDTSGSTQYKDIYIQIPNDEEDLARKQYKVGNITFNINYANTSLKRKKMEIDTLRGIQMIYSLKDIKSDIIAQSIFYQIDSTFKKDDYQKTISRLNELGIFRFVNIKYNPLLVSQTEGYIDTDIVAELRKRQSGKVDLELNTDARDKIGTYVNFTYTNKNIFKRADRLQFNTSGGVEFRFNQTERNEKNNSRVSNINMNVSTRLYFPKIFPEFANKAKKNNYKPIENFKSTFANLGYNLQKKIGYYSYTVNTFNIGYGYDIRGKRFRHEIQPFNLSFIKPREASYNSNFENFLTSNPIFAQSYRQQFIMGQEYVLTFSSQNFNVGATQNFFFYRGTINTAGNLVYGIQSLMKKKPEDGFTLSKIPYASFTKIDNDLRYYFTFKNKTTLAARFFAGVGIPYGNSKTLPFIKQYAAGGPQSMRGWNYRELGPGSADTSYNSLDLNTGDLQLEFNLEYRFSLSKLFKMALFTDVGNIWLMKKDSSMPNANIDIKRLAQDLAWSAGVGFRLDFGLFVIRFDNSYKIYSPNIEKGHRWVTQYPGYKSLHPDSNGRWNQKWKAWRSRYANFVIGIGYPF